MSGRTGDLRCALIGLALFALAGCSASPFADLPGPRGLATIEPAAGPDGDGGGPAVVPAAAVADQPPPVDWQAFADCPDLLRHVHRLAARKELRRSDPPPLVVTTRVAPEDWGWLEDETVWLGRDLPIEVVGGSRALRHAVRCRIEVGPAEELIAEQREIGVEPVASLYHGDSRSTTNPNYDAAKKRVKEAESQLDTEGAGVIGVGDPMLDIVGLLVGSVLSGFKDRSDQAVLNDAMAELVSTPRTLHEPVYRPYSFERTLIRGRKSAIIPVTLIDTRSSRTWQTRLHQREARAFEVLDGLDPRDRDYATYRERSTSRLELKRWHDRPPETALSVIVAALLQPGLRPAVDAAPGH